jgi:hypothetical protein
MRMHAKTYQCILEVLEKHPKLREINKMWSRNERFYEHVSTENLPRRSFRRSEEHLTRALGTIPFGSQTFSKSHIQFPASQAPLYVTHADGCRIFDIDGNDYVDMVNAILPVILGYVTQMLILLCVVSLIVASFSALEQRLKPNYLSCSAITSPALRWSSLVNPAPMSQQRPFD